MIETGLAGGRGLSALAERFARLAGLEGLADLSRWLGEDLTLALPGQRGLLCLCPDGARDWFCFQLPGARFARWKADHPVIQEVRQSHEDGPFALDAGLPLEIEGATQAWCRILRDSRAGLLGLLLLAGEEGDALEDAAGIWLLERAGLVSLFVERLVLVHRFHALESDRDELETLKSRFMDTISHELKTPLTSILGFSSLARREAQALAGSPLPQFLRSIQDSAQRLEALIDEVLVISEMASAKQSLDIQEYELSALLATFQSQCLSERPDGARVSIGETPAGIRLLVDDRRFLRILEHLVGNALAFSAPERPVRLEFKFITGRRRNDRTDFLRIDVVDQGVGIAPDERERIFQRFYQVDGSSTREHGGTGLGLALAKEFTEAMGGRLWVASEPGRGSTFSFTVPVPREAPAES